MTDCETFYSEVGRLLRKSREKRGVTQEALALLVGLTRTSITNIERGRQKFFAHTLMDLATALCVSPTELLPQDEPLLDGSWEEVLSGLGNTERDWIKGVLNNLPGEKP